MTSSVDVKTKPGLFRYAWGWRNVAVLILAPIVLLPLVFCFESEDQMVNGIPLKLPMRCAYVIILMVIFWTMECVPLAITSLLPMVLYPFLSVVSASALAQKYMSEANMTFLGSIIVVTAFQHAELPKLFALRVLGIVGAQPRWLLCGFMLVSWFLSMWTSNTMAAFLLIPIVLSVTAELKKAVREAERSNILKDCKEATETMRMVSTTTPESHRSLIKQDSQESADVSVSIGDSDVIQIDDESTTKSEKTQQRFENMMLLAIAYSSSIGGTVTIIGTAPNLIMKEQVQKTFDDRGCTSTLNFFSWMVYSVPLSLSFLAILWVWIQFYFVGPGKLYLFGCKKSPFDEHKDKILATVKRLNASLPPITFSQYVVLGHCLAMVVLLISRQLNTDPLIGWEILAPGFVSESTATVLISFSLFVFPVSFPKWDRKKGTMILPKVVIDWKRTERDFPIGLVLLIGGGIAAAFGAEKSGLAELLATLLNDLIGGLSNQMALLVMIVFMVYTTEFMSNTACVTLMMPVFASLADRRNPPVNPMLFMLPTGLASSFAFMFPVATPPNAIVFHTGRFRIIDMISAGFVVNLLGVWVVYFATITYGQAYFDLYNPVWLPIYGGVNNTEILGYNCTV